MDGKQLCFFKFDRPLLALLGRDFFRAVPRRPGVYVFTDEGRRVLYVGQSKNLRLRLAYYKNAQPEREPRRIIRLVHQTRSIELYPCESPAAAKLREVELIQEHQPRYNVQHALSRTYTFFGVRRQAERFHVRLTLDERAGEGETLIGAFKNRGLCRRTLFAIGRTHFSRERKPASIYDFPMDLMNRTKINDLALNGDQLIQEQISGLFRGHSNEFTACTEKLVRETGDSFLRQLYESDYLTLLEFFELARRMKKLREQSGFDGLLPQREIDRSAVSRSSETVSAPAQPELA